MYAVNDQSDMVESLCGAVSNAFVGLLLLMMSSSLLTHQSA